MIVDIAIRLLVVLIIVVIDIAVRLLVILIVIMATTVMLLVIPVRNTAVVLLAGRHGVMILDSDGASLPLLTIKGFGLGDGGC